MKYSELNERRDRTSADFPIEYHYVDEHHPRYVMDAHWHTETEILRVTKGVFEIYLNRRHYTLGEGDVAFINAGTVHHGEGEGCIYECVVFRPEMLLQSSGGAVNRYIKPIIRRQRTVRECFLRGSSPEIEGCVQSLLSLLREPHEGYELAVNAELTALFYRLYREGAVEEATLGKGQEKQLEQLVRLLAWLEDHYVERITLEMLSKETGLNEKYLCRFFKAYTAHTPIDYLNRLRIERAADDLRLRSCTVTEAAYANGFNDSAYFSKLFLKIKGLSPGAYKRECAEAKEQE